MFGYSFGELGSIFVMQGFAGLILFSVFVLMALGLAIIFGQLGVINMAHGEFMMMGIVRYLSCARRLFADYSPSPCSGISFFRGDGGRRSVVAVRRWVHSWSGR